MQLCLESTHLGEVRVLIPSIFQDLRGFFSEIYRGDQMAELGLPPTFVQLNHSGSVKGVLRGLHFQWDPPMGKLMRVIRGRAFLVAVDIRKGSPTLGQWCGVDVSSENRKLVWAPACFARGFYVLSDFAEIEYSCTGVYNSQTESGIYWNDPAVGIRWPLDGEALLSEKDIQAPTLAEWLARPESDNFTFATAQQQAGNL